MNLEDSDREIHKLFEDEKPDVLQAGCLENEDFPGNLSKSCAFQALIPRQPAASLAVDCTHSGDHDEDLGRKTRLSCNHLK